MRELAVAIQNENENVNIIQTIESVLDSKMYLFNGMIKIGNIVKLNKLKCAKN